MSWDIFIQDLPDVKGIRQIPENFKPQPIGKREELIQKIKEILPKANFTDPTWGTYESKEIDIEFSMGDEKICDSIAFHVRGGKQAPSIVNKLLKHLKVKALDSGSGDFFSLQKAKKSFQAWNTYAKSTLSKMI